MANTAALVSNYLQTILHKQVGGRRRLMVVVLVVVLTTMVNLAVITNTTNTSITTLAMPRYLTITPHHNATGECCEEESILGGYGVSDASGNYTSHTFAWASSAWAEMSEAGVCLSTHASVDRLHWVAAVAVAWTGPLSVTIFAPGVDYTVAAFMVTYLRRCVVGVAERTSFHLVYPRSNPPRQLGSTSPLHLRCDRPEEANREALRQREHARQSAERRYPQNLLRNVARSACPAQYCLSADVDMVPVVNMWPRMSSHLSSRPGPAPCPRCALVVPIYEVSTSLPALPENKMGLLKLLLKRKARRFHVQVYAKNQGNSRLELWEAEPRSPPKEAYEVLYNITTYEEFWEPVLVLPRTAPPFDERFLGYGFTRSSQVYQLKLLGYQFQVLDEPFFTHRGFQTTSSYTPSRHAQIEINKIRYQIFKRELHARFGLRPPPPLHFSNTPIGRALPLLISRKGAQLAHIIGMKKQEGEGR